jgi:hypothetical protein
LQINILSSNFVITFNKVPEGTLHNKVIGSEACASSLTKHVSFKLFKDIKKLVRLEIQSDLVLIFKELNSWMFREQILYFDLFWSDHLPISKATLTFWQVTLKMKQLHCIGQIHRHSSVAWKAEKENISSQHVFLYQVAIQECLWFLIVKNCSFHKKYLRKLLTCIKLEISVANMF